jgi:hypothetical protein
MNGGSIKDASSSNNLRSTKVTIPRQVYDDVPGFDITYPRYCRYGNQMKFNNSLMRDEYLYAIVTAI